MRIRRGTIDEVTTIDAQIFKVSGPPSAEELAESAWWVVEDDGALVGYAGVWVKAAKKAGYLTRAGVLPCARGRGLQRRLLRVREAYARKHGCERTMTYTYLQNFASMANLSRSGYCLYYVEAGNDYAWWQKALLPGVKLKAFQAPDYQD